MEEVEHSEYVAQLRAEFDSCDSTCSGFLDRDELTALCHKLHLDNHLPLLLERLLGPHPYGRVNFEEFKEGFVAVLSRSLDFSTSEDDSSYLEPAVPEEVKPKFVKGSKRYGRRSRPDSKPDSDQDSPPDSSRSEDRDQARVLDRDQVRSTEGVRRAKLRRATSLESIESLKSDEEATDHRDVAQNKGEQLEEGGVKPGECVLTEECEHLDLQPLSSEDVCFLLRRLDADVEGRVSLRDVHRVLCSPAPVCSSTPLRTPAQVQSGVSSEERLFQCSSPSRSQSRSQSWSLLTPAVGQRVLSRLDDGTGAAGPEQVMALWREEGLRDSQDVLQLLDFSLDERLSLTDLTLALDNELLISGNSLHQAALISYKTELQHLQTLAEQACRERDKAKSDLDQADLRNLQLIREVDERQTSLETSTRTRIRDLEQDFRERLAVLRGQMEQENEAQLQQLDKDNSELQEELLLLRTREPQLQEELSAAQEENRRLEEELAALKLKLNEAEISVEKLQRDLDQILLEKFSLDPSDAGLSHEERFCEIIKEYEQQCRELRDRNDELSSELELIKSQRLDRKTRRDPENPAELTWSQQNQDQPDQDQESDSDESYAKHRSPRLRRKLTPADKSALCSLDSGLDSGPGPGPGVSIQTELALEQLQQKHQQELQQLHIQLETQVNYYERSLEQMRQSMELERKDISQAFKLEICELEEQKTDLEQQLKQLRENMEKIQQQQTTTWSNEQQKRMQRERAELEQNFAREIGNLVQRLSSEKDQLEAELRLKMDQEVLLVRMQLEEVRTENSALQERLALLQQEVQTLEEEVAKKQRKLEELERDREGTREEQERLHKENAGLREQVLDLSSRNLDLSNTNAELSGRLRGDQEAVSLLRERLSTVSREQEQESATVRRLQEELVQTEREKQQKLTTWNQDKKLLETELTSYRSKVSRVSDLEAELNSVSLKLQWTQDDNNKLKRETEDRKIQMEQFQSGLHALEQEADALRSQLQSTNQEALNHEQEVAHAHRKIQDAQNKVEELESSLRKLLMEKEEVTSSMEEELQQLRVQNQELVHKLREVQTQNQEIHKLNQQQLDLRTQLDQLETAKSQAQDQALRADTALSLVQAQHVRQLQEIQNRTETGSKEELESLQNRLRDETRRREKLEETLRIQSQQSSCGYAIKQEQYEKAMSVLQQRTDDLETQLKATRSLLQEKGQQLKEQMARSSQDSALVAELYLHTSELQGALQVTEQRQKQAEKKNQVLESRVQALNQILRQIVPLAV